MTRSSLLHGLLGLIGVGLLGALPLACSGGGVGDPCIPEDEYDPQFAGFTLSLENIESRSFQCETRVCLVNHFQGRVSCPLGQEDRGMAKKTCGTRGSNGSVVAVSKDDPNYPCASDEECVESVPIAEDCDPTAPSCPPPGGCNKTGKFCECTSDQTAPASGYICDTSAYSSSNQKGQQFRAFICHKKNNCQQIGQTSKQNCNSDGTPKDCCVPGTDQPIASEVCGQCNGERSADDAVYCSCRCGVAQGQPMDPNFNFCSCPTGYTCSPIRPFEGLGDPELAGSYCIKAGSAYDSTTAATSCQVPGHLGESCSGTPSLQDQCGG